MPHYDARIDAYIDRAADFAKPILKYLRKLVHQACPEVEEAIKWGFPHFLQRGILCSMAAFKQHCAFGFWKRELLFRGNSKLQQNREAMGQFGRLTAIADLPKAQVLLAYIREAARLNNAGTKSPSKPKPKIIPELRVPDFFARELKKNARAQATFQSFSPSHRREYIDWITEAKTEPTRQKRIATTLAWLKAGKPRNWKYMRC
jgi:uncharacterized protein YdeI (YjbR/CyaY-like superfamily)